MPKPRIRITVDGKPALTVEQAAARKGVAESTMRKELSRYEKAIRPVADLDGRKKLYLEADLDTWWSSRPGKGAPGVAKPHRAKGKHRPDAVHPAARSLALTNGGGNPWASASPGAPAPLVPPAAAPR